MMKITFAFSVLLVALIHTAFAITPELERRAAEAREKCKDATGLNEEKKEDCHAACFMKNMGYMTNGEINVKNMEEANKQKWDDQDMINKGIYVDTTCAKQVGDTKGKNECTIGYEFGRCKTKLVKETGLQPPSPLKPKEN